MKYLVAATRLLAKNLEIEKHYFTGKWEPANRSGNLCDVPVIGMSLANARAFDNWEDAYVSREEIKNAFNGNYRDGTQFRIYGVEDKEIFEARLRG